jgi:hypothetical protein
MNFADEAAVRLDRGIAVGKCACRRLVCRRDNPGAIGALWIEHAAEGDDLAGVKFASQ